VDLHVVRRRDDAASFGIQALRDEVRAGLLLRMQAVPALGIEAFASQFGETRHAPNIRGDVEIAPQQIRGAEHFAQNRAAAGAIEP
jgi:hypothetical protein